MYLENKDDLYRSIFSYLYDYFGGIEGITYREDRLGMTDQIYAHFMGLD